MRIFVTLHDAVSWCGQRRIYLTGSTLRNTAEWLGNVDPLSVLLSDGLPYTLYLFVARRRLETLRRQSVARQGLEICRSEVRIASRAARGTAERWFNTERLPAGQSGTW